MFSIIGILAILGICYLASRNRKLINYRTIISGLIIQVLLCIFILKLDIGKEIFTYIGLFIKTLIGFSDHGGKFVFGELYNQSFIFFFHLICSITFICALFAVLAYIGVLHPTLRILSKVFQKVMNVSGIESLICISSALVGQVESSLPFRSYFKHLSSSQFFSIMVGGMSTMSMVLLAIYAGFGIPIEYLLAANLMGIPAGLVVSKILYPSSPEELKQSLPQADPDPSHNIMDAMIRGAQDGFHISMSIMAVAIAIISLAALIDGSLQIVHTSLSEVLGLVFFPIIIIMGLPFDLAFDLASLLGQKIALNEFIAYTKLAETIKTSQASPEFVLLSSFLLCGFANLGSVAIQLGAFTQIIPEKREELSKLGLWAMIGAILATCLSTCWAHLLYSL